MKYDPSEILFRSFLQESPGEQFWHGQGCPLFDVVHPAFPLPTTASPTLQGVLKDGFGEAVVACDMREPYLLLLLTVHANFCTHVVRAVGHALPLFCGDFLSICPCSVYELSLIHI